MRKRKSQVFVDAARWAAYATAGMAASIGVQSIAEADIHFSNPEIQLLDPEPGNGSFGYFEIPVASGTGLLFRHAYNELGSGIGWFAVNAGSGLAISIAGSTHGNYFYGSNLDYGQRVSTLQSWVAPGERLDLMIGHGSVFSQFFRSGYLAFRFDVGNGTQYGWAQLTQDADVPANIFTLNTIAWGDPGDALTVGKVPEPGSLGLLAMGAAGLLGWRRHKKNAKA